MRYICHDFLPMLLMITYQSVKTFCKKKKKKNYIPRKFFFKRLLVSYFQKVIAHWNDLLYICPKKKFLDSKVEMNGNNNEKIEF